MHIYLKNNPAKFHPDPIWNGGDLGLFWKRRPNNENNNKMSTGSDTESVPHLNNNSHIFTQQKLHVY